MSWRSDVFSNAVRSDIVFLLFEEFTIQKAAKPPPSGSRIPSLSGLQCVHQAKNIFQHFGWYALVALRSVQHSPDSIPHTLHGTGRPNHPKVIIP